MTCTILVLTIYTRLCSHSQWSSCLCLPCARIKSEHFSPFTNILNSLLVSRVFLVSIRGLLHDLYHTNKLIYSLQQLLFSCLKQYSFSSKPSYRLLFLFICYSSFSFVILVLLLFHTVNSPSLYRSTFTMIISLVYLFHSSYHFLRY